MFMEIQKTVGMEFVEIETRQSGTTWYPGDEHDEESARAEHDGETIEYVGSRVGYGVRLSAPGYLDCTEWEVFPTAEEADARADELQDESDELQDETE